MQLFTALSTQWRTANLEVSAMGMARSEVVKTGLDYAAVEPAARMKGLGRVKPAEFLALQILEGEALACMAEERAARS